MQSFTKEKIPKFSGERDSNITENRERKLKIGQVAH